VPALPYMFDKPVEEATEWLFYNAFKAIGGEKAVGERKHGHAHPEDEKIKIPRDRKKEL
jgi:mitochondrial fission process protein 1